MINHTYGVCRPLINDIVWLTANGFPVFDRKGELREIIVSFTDITERKKAEQELQQRLAQEKFIAYLSASFMTDSQGPELTVDLALMEIGEYLGAFGVSLITLQDLRMDRIFHWDRRHLLLPESLKSLLGQKVASWMLAADTQRGIITGERLEELVWQDRKLAGFLKENGVNSLFPIPLYYGSNLNGAMVLMSDKKGQNWELSQQNLASLTGDLAVNVIKRRDSERKLQESLQVKETLLKEVHHRVKNNLQTINSLLNLQARKIKDPSVREAFEQSQQRIMAMSFIHQVLYQTQGNGLLDFNDYMHRLVASLMQSHQSKAGKVDYFIKIHDIMFDIDRAITCGLIANELVTNSLKHAFPRGRKGRIEVTLDKTEQGYRLKVSDDGIGLPTELDPDRAETLGLKLVKVLTGQMKGTMMTGPGPGANFIIDFKTTS